MYLAPFCLRLQKQQSKVKRCQTGAHIFFADHSVVLSSLLLLTLMQKLTPEQKHSILTHYTSRRDGETLDQIFALHGVKASRQSFFVWMKQWDGTPQCVTLQSSCMVQDDHDCSATVMSSVTLQHAFAVATAVERLCDTQDC